MKGQSGRHEEMCTLRSDKACDWLLKHPSFVRWLTSADVHQLLLLGEMGSGKSVVVSYLIDSLTRLSNHQLPRPHVCYYYCSDGSTLSATKIYLVLISSLTIKLPGLRKTFYEWYQERQAAANIEPSMDSRQLGDFLRDVLEDLDRPLFIVIDGLDECERRTRYNICGFLTAVCKRSPRVKTFVSSRIEEEVLEMLSDITTIRLPTDAKRDHIIVEHLVKNNLPSLEREVETLVIERMSSLAQGSAIWIKMTIELIEKKGIRNRHKMQRLLDNASSSDKLLDLYAALFTKGAGKDQENQELATTGLKLLAVSRRPLSILELAWGVTLAIDAKQVGSVADLAERVDYQRIMRLIRPFVSRIDFADLKKRQVRFVHQSVKRFVLESPVLNQLYSHNLIGQPTALEDETSSTLQLERSILDICVAYLLLDEVGRINLFSEEQVMIDALPQDISTLR